MKADIVYQFSRYYSILKLLINKQLSNKYETYLIFKKNKIYFNNINAMGIINKNIDEMGKNKIEIYNKVDYFIDVGAHVGIVTLLFNQINPRVDCIAFEPNPISYNFLRRNVGNSKQIKIYNSALGDRKCKMKIYYDRDHLDTSSLEKHSVALINNAKVKIKSFKIPVNRLDDYYHLFKDKKNIYLKIDSEGYERNILLGAKKTLNNVRFLNIEISQYNNKLFFSDIFKFITPKKNIKLLDADFFWSKSYIPISTNVVFELF